MPKHIIVFDANEPDDLEELKITMAAVDLHAAASRFSEWLRCQEKSAEDEERLGVIELCRRAFWDHFEGLID